MITNKLTSTPRGTALGDSIKICFSANEITQGSEAFISSTPYPVERVHLDGSVTATNVHGVTRRAKSWINQWPAGVEFLC